jgi:hypothetical protein
MFLMRRALLSVLALSLLALPSAASAGPRLGVSDQLASTFSSPLYAPLHLTMARYIAPWDVMSRPADRAQLVAWVTAAQLAHQRILVAFEVSHTRGHQRKLPSRAAYTKAIAKFHRAYPQIKEVQPWNEVNRQQHSAGGGYLVGQPTWRNPKAAAVYYMAARKVFRGDRVTGLDILDQADVRPAVRYIKKFLHYAHPRPRYWGFHNYSDTNRFSSQRTKALLKATGSGEVWLTETGGIVHLGNSFPYNTKRAAKALGCMFTIAKSSRRITRLYIYQFNGVAKGGDNAFDAGLLNANQTARPGYSVVKHRKAGRCHR